jgi:hypothetical protein
MEILQEVAAGHRNRDIAARLFIAERTVKVHVKYIRGKLVGFPYWRVCLSFRLSLHAAVPIPRLVPSVLCGEWTTQPDLPFFETSCASVAAPSASRHCVQNRLPKIGGILTNGARQLSITDSSASPPSSRSPLQAQHLSRARAARTHLLVRRGDPGTARSSSTSPATNGSSCITASKCWRCRPSGMKSEPSTSSLERRSRRSSVRPI